MPDIPHPSAACLIDPADIDWSTTDDLSVLLSAQAGTAEAIVEAKLRVLTIDRRSRS